MQGHFTVEPDCPTLVGKVSRCHAIHSRYGVLDFSLPNPKDSQGYWIPLPRSSPRSRVPRTLARCSGSSPTS